MFGFANYSRFATRLLVRHALEGSGFEAKESEDGMEALRAFGEARPDIVLLDVMMPNMDGFQACAAMRELHDGEQVPIVGNRRMFSDKSFQHLDSLLSIKELSAIQWVYGAGNGRASDWLHVYRKCQAAGKGLQLHLDLDEIDVFMDNLRPEGLWIGINGVRDRGEGEEVIRKIAGWKRRGGR